MKKTILMVLMVFVALFAVNCAKDADFIEMQANSDADAQEMGAEVIRYNGNQGEPVVMVHGNAGSPSNWNRTVTYFTSHGWPSSKIIRPSWGTSNASNNDHCGAEIDAVKSAIKTAVSQSSTGKIDVMGHSMGATLAAKAILELGYASKVRTFVGIAGAFRGLNSCTYTSYLPTCSTTCGLHYNSNVINYLKNKRWAQKQYAIYSWVDEIVCNCGAGYNMSCCYIYGVHSSKPHVLDGSYSKSVAPYGHFGILYYTESKQADYCDNY
jgi:pimeloyl-ACP methyl ester carboxylesterase